MKIIGPLGNVEQPQKTSNKNPAAVAFGRLGGLKGGRARAKKLTPEQRSAIARKAAHERWRKVEINVNSIQVGKRNKMKIYEIDGKIEEYKKQMKHHLVQSQQELTQAQQMFEQIMVLEEIKSGNNEYSHINISNAVGVSQFQL